MYQLAVHAHQVLSTTLITVSLTETDEDGKTVQLASAVGNSNLFANLDEDPLWIFLEQTTQAIVKTLSTTAGGPWLQTTNRDGLDGGWRGAGIKGQPERSEDPNA